jgi:hypothetical protein
MVLLTTQLALLSSCFRLILFIAKDFETWEPIERETVEEESIIFFKIVSKSMCTFFFSWPSSP